MNKADLERALKRTVGAALKRTVVEVDGDYLDIDRVERQGETVVLILRKQPEVESLVAS